MLTGGQAVRDDAFQPAQHGGREEGAHGRRGVRHSQAHRTFPGSLRERG